MPPRPAVLILAVPHVYATALALNLGEDASYDICHPNVRNGEELPETPVDVAITNLPISTACARVHIRLPDAAGEPLVLTVNGTRIAVQTEGESCVADLVALVRKYAWGEETKIAPVA